MRHDVMIYVVYMYKYTLDITDSDLKAWQIAYHNRMHVNTIEWHVLHNLEKVNLALSWV